MDILIIEGTVEEVERKIRSLPVKPESRLRVVISEAVDGERNESDLLAYAARRNGLILVPSRVHGRTITTELVNSLSED